MLLKSGYKGVYVSRTFALKHGLIPAKVCPWPRLGIELMSLVELGYFWLRWTRIVSERVSTTRAHVAVSANSRSLLAAGPSCTTSS
jgi:hypothetical protein